MSEKKRVIVYCPGTIRSSTEYRHGIAENLYRVGIDIRSKYKGMIIETPHIVIELIPSSVWYSCPDKFRGKRYDECFGFTDYDVCYLRKDHNVGKNYKGSLLDYVCEIELGMTYLEAPFVYGEEVYK